MSSDPPGFYASLRVMTLGMKRPVRRAQRRINAPDSAGRADALRASENAAREGRSAEVLEIAGRHLRTDPAAHELLELYLEACRIQGERPEVAAAVVAMAAEVGLYYSADQRGLLDWVLFLGRSEHLEQLAASKDPVVRLVAQLRNGRGETTTRAEHEVEASETPGNAARAILIAAAWSNNPTALHDRSIHAQPGWVPTVTLRRAIRVAVADRDVTWARALLSTYRVAAPADPWASSINDRIRTLEIDDAHVAQNGFPYSPWKARNNPRDASDTVLYAVHSSYPFHGSGYSVRTHALTRAMATLGINVRPVTRYGYPVDFGFRTTQPVDTVDEIPYQRLLPSAEPMRKSPLVPYVMRYADHLEALAKSSDAGLIHAASNYLNGFAANEAARRLGVPSIYEVRGLWEITRASRDPVWGRSAEFHRLATLEAHAARDADHVITLTLALANEMIRRGVPQERITVIPNGVDVGTFNPIAVTEHESPTDTPLTLGYIGSLVDYEGLDLLIRALHAVRRKLPRIRARIVGDGAEAESLQKLAKDLRVADRVDFVGHVPHESILAEYSKIDVLVFPRLPLPVCQLVAPLKPYEAMALQKPVIASDVAALKEIVAPCGPEAMFSAGNVRSLAHAIRRIASDDRLRDQVAVRGHAYITQTASWTRRAHRLQAVYSRVVSAMP